MPVSTENSISGPYTPNGVTTDFAFDFKATAANEVVALDQNGATISAALYSVELDEDEGGTLSFSVAPTFAQYAQIFIAGNPALTQPSDFDNAGPSFNPAALTRALDRAAARDLRQQRDIDRGLKVAFGETAPSLPALAERKGKFLGFSSVDGSPVATEGTDTTIGADLASADDGKGADIPVYRVPSGAAVTRTVKDKLLESVSVGDFGATLLSTDNSAAIQAAIDHVESLGGGELKFPPGVMLSGKIVPGNRVVMVGAGKGSTVLKLKDGANSNFVETRGFASFADDTKRSYSYYASTAARNAAARSTGTYAMVASAQTDFNNATWYVATATPATSDGDWTEVDPVVGCVAGGIRDMTIDGNAANQTGSFVACGWYGINTLFKDVNFENAGTPLHGEAPGQAFSTVVGENLQGTVAGIEIRKFTDTGFINNMQSDGAVYDLQIYADDTVTLSNALLHFKQKASGQKWDGLHIWGGGSATVGLIMDAATVVMTNSVLERPAVINQGGFCFKGQVYRINDASRTDGPAFTLASGIIGNFIEARVNHFRYCLKRTTAGGLANDFNFTHFSQDGAAAFLDPTGATSRPSNDHWIYKTSYAGGVPQALIPAVESTRFRRARQLIAYASTITPNLANGDYIKVGQLTGNITINAPTNAQDGDEVQFYFQQDGTGSRTITWNSVFVGGPTAGGPAFQRRAVSFVYDGIEWILSGDSGGWI